METKLDSQGIVPRSKIVILMLLQKAAWQRIAERKAHNRIHGFVHSYPVW